jgi:alpha-glucosidase
VALGLRRTEEELRAGDFAWLDAPADCLAYRRGQLTVVLNAGPRSVPLPAGDLLLASGPLDGPELPPNTAAWVLGS